MYIKTFHKKVQGKIYSYQYLVQSYRVGKKVTSRLLSPLGNPDDPHSPAGYIRLLEQAHPRISTTKLYTLPVAINMIIEKTLQLPQIFADIFPDTVKLNVLLLTKLMLMGRILNPDSKLSLTRWYHHVYLPEKLPKRIAVHQFYYTLDYLLENKEEIEKRLFTRLCSLSLIDATIVFYDLTSSYFEGEDVAMAKFGYSRDHRPDCLQITLGLVIDRRHGLPIYHEVFEGNMRDSQTVKGILEKLEETFQLQHIIIVADKGMLTPDTVEELREKQYQSILSEIARNALSQKQRENLFLQKDGFQKLEDMEDRLWYTTTQDKEGEEIIVCYNQYTARKAKQTRDTKIAKVTKFIKETKEKHKAVTEKKDMQKVRDMIMAKLVTSHTRKYFDTKEKTTIAELYPLKEDVMKREEYMDGMWVIRSNAKQLTTEALITTYKDLKTIEASFRVIKDVIEVRPIYHHKDNRVKGHVFMCILAFLVARLLEQKTGQTIKMLKEDYMTSVILPEKEQKESAVPLLQHLEATM